MRQAVIFDMDGVISDTQKFHAQVESVLLEEVGISLSPTQITQQYAGVDDDVMFEELFNTYNVKGISITNIIKKKWKLIKKFATGNIQAIPYVIDLIQNLKNNNFKLAVCSSSRKAFISTVLTELHIAEYFDVVVSAEEVEEGKPAPDIFLFAAKKMGVEPVQIVVIEDGTSGMVAAAKAGMKSIGLVTDKKQKYPATMIVTSLKEVSTNTIHSLL